MFINSLKGSLLPNFTSAYESLMPFIDARGRTRPLGNVADLLCQKSVAKHFLVLVRK